MGATSVRSLGRYRGQWQFNKPVTGFGELLLSPLANLRLLTEKDYLLFLANRVE